jgi:endonuclease YncB( thermonuclease family)
VTIGPGALPGDGYWRRAVVLDVHDGDTLKVAVDLGFGAEITLKLRVSHVNAPELSTPAGVTARDYTDAWVSHHASHYLGVTPVNPFLVHYDGWDNYGGRFDGVLVCGANHCLNDDLLSSGNALPYPAVERQRRTLSA